MNWSLLFPTTVNPWKAIIGVFSGGANGLSDGIIWLTILIAVVTLLYALWKLYCSWHLVGRYLQVLPTSPDPHAFGESVENWPKANNLPLLTEFRRLLVAIPSPSAKPSRPDPVESHENREASPAERSSNPKERPQYRRVGASEEIFDERSLAQGLISNRFILATPAILTGLGVLGTFVGLQLGIGSLDLQGSPDFKAESFADPRALIRQLQDGNRPVDRFLWSQFPEPTKSLLASLPPEAPTLPQHTEDGLRNQLAENLNRLIKQDSFGRHEAFNEVGTSGEGDTLSHPHSQADPRRSNRQRLQDAFPTLIEPPSSSQDLERGITPLIQGSAVAFSTSVWGVACSLIFSILEKGVESACRKRIRRLQDQANRLIPRYTPEESLLALSQSAQSSDNTLKGLAGAIGVHMQKAIDGIGEAIIKALEKAAAKGSEDLGEKSAKLISAALTAELNALRETVDDLGKSLKNSVEGIAPVVGDLNTTVNASLTAVTNAVAKLNSHEAVMEQMAQAAKDLSYTAAALREWKDSLELSAERNKEAAGAQEKAAASNIKAAGEFTRIVESLPGLQTTIGQAATVIGSIGTPLVEFKKILSDLPRITSGVGDGLKNQGKEFSDSLLKSADSLAQKVGDAADKIAKVSGLAEKLEGAAESLRQASSGLESFGTSIEEAAEKHRLSARASERAAGIHEKVAEQLGPLPASFSQLKDGLSVAGESIRRGAETAKESYREAASVQEVWLNGVSVGLDGMTDRMQHLMDSYGDAVQGKTGELMENWTQSVKECLASYETQVETIHGCLADLQDALDKRRQ